MGLTLLEQEQPDGSVRPIAYVSRATLDSERQWIPLDLEAGTLIGRSRAFEATFGAGSFAFFWIIGPWKLSEKIGATTRESSGDSSISPCSTTHSSRKDKPGG